jgi:hypothetical protein
VVPEKPALKPILGIMQQLFATFPANRPTTQQAKQQLWHLDSRTIGMSLFRQAKERRQQTKVLYECFPPHIAEALKRGDKVEPEHHAMVSLFFSDIVGFTAISSRLTPEQVSDMLHRLCTIAQWMHWTSWTSPTLAHRLCL